MKTISKLEEVINDGETYQINLSLTSNHWKQIEKSLDEYCDANPIPKEFNLEKEKISLEPLLKISSIGIKSISNALFFEHNGAENSHGSSMTFFKELMSNRDYEWLNDLQISENKIESMISAFLLVHVLPTKNVWWHGAYGLDYQFSVDKDILGEIYKVMKGDEEPEDDDDYENDFDDEEGFDSSASDDGPYISILKSKNTEIKEGLFISKSGNSYKLWAYGFTFYGRIMKISIRITNKSIEQLEEEVLEKGSMICY